MAHYISHSHIQRTMGTEWVYRSNVITYHRRLGDMKKRDRGLSSCEHCRMQARLYSHKSCVRENLHVRAHLEIKNTKILKRLWAKECIRRYTKEVGITAVQLCSHLAMSAKAHGNSDTWHHHIIHRETISHKVIQSTKRTKNFDVLGQREWLCSVPAHKHLWRRTTGIDKSRHLVTTPQTSISRLNRAQVVSLQAVAKIASPTTRASNIVAFCRTLAMHTA